MQFYKVPFEFLAGYKKLAQKYGGHAPWCNNNFNNLSSIFDYCNCGYSNLCKELQELGTKIEKI